MAAGKPVLTAKSAFQTQIPPMHYPVKDKPTTPKQASYQAS
jgi:hypothetical protein